MPRKIVMPSADEIANAYGASGGKAQTEYVKGIDANTDAMDRAKSDMAESNYASGVATAAANRTRQKALADVSQEEWKKAAKDKASRLSSGIAGAKEKQRKGYAPIRDALSGLELPDKTTDPYSNVDNILKKVISAERKAAGKE